MTATGACYFCCQSPTTARFVYFWESMSVNRLLYDKWQTFIRSFPNHRSHCFNKNIRTLLEYRRSVWSPHAASKVSKNATTLYHYNAWIDFDIFGVNVTEKVGNQKILYFPTSPNSCFCTTRQIAETQNRILSLKCCTIALPDFNQ